MESPNIPGDQWKPPAPAQWELNKKLFSLKRIRFSRDLFCFCSISPQTLATARPMPNCSAKGWGWDESARRDNKSFAYLNLAPHSQIFPISSFSSNYTKRPMKCMTKKCSRGRAGGGGEEEESPGLVKIAFPAAH